MAYANLDGLGWLVEDMQTWTATHYEPKLRFDPVPVYSVTLAEDITISSSDTFDIALTGGNYKRCNIYTVAPAVDANRTVRVSFSMASEISVKSAFIIAATAQRYGIVRFMNDSGLAYCDTCSGSSGGVSSIATFTGPANSPPTPVEDDDTITSISLYAPSDMIIPAGTTITVYAATEV